MITWTSILPGIKSNKLYIKAKVLIKLNLECESKKSIHLIYESFWPVPGCRSINSPFLSFLTYCMRKLCREQKKKKLISWSSMPKLDLWITISVLYNKKIFRFKMLPLNFMKLVKYNIGLWCRRLTFFGREFILFLQITNISCDMYLPAI